MPSLVTTIPLDLSLFFSRNPQAMWVLEAGSMRFLEVNAAAQAMYGYSRREFLRRSIFDLRPDADRRKVRKTSGLLRRAGEPFVGHVPHRRKDGKLINVEIVAFPIEFRGGQAWLATIVDRTRTLFEAQSLPLLFQKSPQAMWVFDVGTLRFLAVNDAAVRLFGYSREEFAVMTLSDIRRAAEIPKMRQRVRRAAARDAYHVGTVNHIKKNGACLEVDVFSHNLTFGGRKARLSLLNDVTDSRRLERELRASEERYRSLYSRSPAMMHSIDGRGRVLSVSDAWLSTLGYKREEVIGRDVLDFVTPRSRRWGRTVGLPSFYKTGFIADAPYEFVKKNGEIVETLVSATAERDADGRVIRSLTVVRDVTASKRAQSELLEATAWLEALFSSSRDGICVISSDGRIVRVNDAYERMTGKSRRELLKMTVVQNTRAEDLRQTTRTLRELRRGAPTSTLEKVYVHRDGRRVPVELVGFPVKDGRRLLGFAAFVRDITERKEAERKLAEAHAWFEALVASSGDAIDTVSRDGRILDCNPALERLLGYSRGELLRKKFHALTPPEYHALDEQAFARLEKGAPSVEFEKEFIRKDGARVPVSLTGFAVKDRGGAVLGYAAIIRDIAERRRLERRISEASAREQSRIGRDLHDSVGQTLTALSLLSRSLRAGLTGVSASQAQRLEELSRMAIQQVRGVARGLLPAELEAGDLGAALTSLAEGARQLFALQCTARVRGDGLLEDKAAAVDLYRIAQEAVVNAAKHSGAGEIGVSLEIGRRRLRLVVRDDGKGIGDGQPAGAGLGLAIMRHRAESLGGVLQIRRGRPTGTEIVCDAPVPAGSRATRTDRR